MPAAGVEEYSFSGVEEEGRLAGIVLSRVGLAWLEQYLEPPDRHDLWPHFLTAEEGRKFSSFHLPKRRREWLGGRVAAKHAVLKILGLPPNGWQEVRIRNDVHGRPFPEVAGNPVPDLAISISHSDEVAVAMAGWSPCGIDVQQLGPAVLKIRDRFAGLEEQEVLAAAAATRELSEIVRLTILWAAKEAIRKMIPVAPLLWFTELTLSGISLSPFAPQLLRLDIVSRRRGFSPAGDHFEVWAHLDEGSALAFCCLSPSTTGGEPLWKL